MNIQNLQDLIAEYCRKYPQIKASKLNAITDTVTFSLETTNPRGELYHRHYEIDSMISERHCQEFIDRVFRAMAGEVQTK